MKGSAQLDIAPHRLAAFAMPEIYAPSLDLELPSTRPSPLRLEAAERLAAHRQRRGKAAIAQETARKQPSSPRNRIAVAVAERYAQTPSYRAILAQQAKLAIQQAAAAAEIAVRNAEAVAAAQQELLGELELWNAPQAFTPGTAQVVAPQSTPLPSAARPALTVKLYEELRSMAPDPTPGPPTPTVRHTEREVEEARALDAEIAFRQAPVFEDYWLENEEHVAIPANLLEFPRQLIASRKARPRIAEGPLRDEITPRTAQLRIFEVEPEQISTTPFAIATVVDWTSIHLDAQPPMQVPAPARTAAETAATPILRSMLPPQTAPLELRFMSSLVDLLLSAGGALAFIAAYARAGGELLAGTPAVIAVCGILAVTFLLYQLLFFTFADQTPGMRYARIGLCTFTDDNPTRSAMRRRILTQLVALCPLGLGLLWIVLDDDGLGWHDRISRMYQRAY